MRFGFTIVPIVAAGLGCASGPRPAATETPVAQRGKRPPLRIVEGAYGEEHSKKAEELVVPFAVNQNGTELILVATEQAEKAGAAFVGDMAVVMTFKWGGTPVECTSRIVFEDDPVLQKKARGPGQEEGGVYSTQVEGYQPKLVAYHAEEQELFCTEAQRQVARDVPTTWNRSDVAEGRMKERSGAPGSEKVLTGETYLQCEKRPVVRDTQRYEHEIKLGFVPPDLTFLSSRLGGGRKLVQAPPVCFSLDEAEMASRPPYRLVAKAFHQGPYLIDEPTPPPSATFTESMDHMDFELLVDKCVESGGRDPRQILSAEEYCRMRWSKHQRSSGNRGSGLGSAED